MSLHDKYTDLVNLVLVKKLRNPSALVKLLNEIQELSEFFGTLKGDTGQVTASTAADEFTIEGGDYINTLVQEVGGVKKVTLNSTLSPLNYKGTYDASTGTYPSGADEGDYYVVNTAGTISGTLYNVGDWMVYNGTDWDKLEGSTIVENDTSPKLGGDLDLNTHLIKDTGGNTILDSDGSGTISGAVKDYADARVSDGAYAGTWNGVGNIAPSKNAVYDKFESLSGSPITTVTDVSNLQSAVDAGGLIYLPAGTYTLTATIDIDQNKFVWIFGDGEETIIDSGGDRVCFDFGNSGSYVASRFSGISNIKLQAPDLTTEQGIVKIHDTLAGYRYIFKNIYFEGQDGDRRGYGINIVQGQANIRDCEFGGLTNGIRMNDSNSVSYVSNCYINRNITGILIVSGKAIISGNYSSNNYHNGIEIQSNLCNINGNTCYDNAQADDGSDYAGIKCSGDKNSINGNTCNGNTNAGAGTGYGILDSGTNNTIMGNTLLDNDTNIDVSGATNPFYQTATDGDDLNNIA
jgi:hypothetical protein